MVELVMVVECIVCMLFLFLDVLMHGCLVSILLKFFFFLLYLNLVVNLIMNFVILKEVKYWFIYAEMFRWFNNLNY